MIQELESILSQVFKELGYETTAKVIKSNRPDLCDYQCDNAFSLAKLYHQNPMEIGNKIVDALKSIDNFSSFFESVTFAPPGFINMTVSNKFINKYIRLLKEDFKALLPKEKPETFVLDFGGANVAKPLHVGHMRTIMVGESVARIIRFLGHITISDVHLGDFGLQIGQVIYGVLRDGKSIDDIDIKYLDKIYPEMSALCKENEEIKEKCAILTKELQDGNKEYQKLWKKILEVSIQDIKKNYDYLGANFDLWLGESDSYKHLDELVTLLEKQNLLEISEGARVIDVSLETDKKEVPPLLFQKSNGAYLYASTDLATILQRKNDYDPDHILYVVDNRQSLHFEQVFRASDKALIMPYNSLEHLGYGTVNGEDGKPYKTRSGETPKLETLFEKAKEIFISKKETNKDMKEEDVDKIVNAILKFADLQNSREKDYIFDLNKFSDVSGKTGPYILYTYLRINKILKDSQINTKLTDVIYNKYDRDLRLKLIDFSSYVMLAFKERKPHYIADYVYNLCVACNIFYQNNYISNMEDEVNKNDWLYVLELSNKVIKEMLDLLVIEIPSVM
ncbi:MAG: arginine--tRNA ligase [Firmicutes bacterium]|nr:arginine--tRNA ligase [Bacillota bacterium]